LGPLQEFNLLSVYFFEQNATQWVQTAKDAGFKIVILTAKHADGFCLWPTAYSNYSVKSSPWRNGTGDVVREVAEAAKNEGVEFGIYMSPLDRHEPTFGNTTLYNEHYLGQLRELLSM
jgi:alpha-L-fucosidase